MPRGDGVLNVERLLTLEEIRAHLDQLPGWEQDGNEIMWRYKAPSFSAAISLVNAVAALAEKANHHPDILVQCCNVEFFLSTHSAGGLTSRDFALAARINQLVS
jgi:4a-hydroxytetrahydrobiopterin dehydratase